MLEYTGAALFNLSMDSIDYERLFNTLEEVGENVLPARLEKLYEKVRNCQEALTDLAADGGNELQISELTSQIIDELDSESPFTSQVVKVTGQITRTFYNELDGTYEEGTVLLDQEPMISQGFYALMSQDDDDRRTYQIGHYFAIPAGTELHNAAATPFVDIIRRHYAFAPVGSVDIEYERTDEEDTLILESLIPDVLADFDTIVLNSENECEALKRLRRMSISRDDDIPAELAEKLLGYAQNRLGFDMEVPYQFEIQGLLERGLEGAITENPSIGFLYVRDGPMRFIGYVSGLMLNPVARLENKEITKSVDYRWFAIVQVVPSEPNGERATISVPVHTIRHMSSLRRSAYEVK